MTTKFIEAVKRQTVLAAKAAEGKATPDELAELAKVNAVLKAATEPEAPAQTKLTTMTLAEFREWHEKAVKQIEDGAADATLLSVVKRNIAAVKDQGKTKADEIVAVELPVEKTETDKVADLESRIADLEAKLAGATATGDQDTSKANGDKPTAQALAMEAIDTLIAKYTKIKALIDAGGLTQDELRKMYDSDWQLKDFISAAAAVLAKADNLKAMAEAVLPEIKKLDTEGAEGAEGAEGTPAEGTPAEGTSAEGTPAEGTEKSASRWVSGLDMAPELKTSEEQKAAIKATKMKNGF